MSKTKKKQIKMSYYMTNVIISPTLYEEKRLEAISYFSRCSKEAALKIHKKNKYKDIKIKAKYYSSSYNRS